MTDNVRTRFILGLSVLTEPSQTTMNIASVTKAFTASALGLLIHDFKHG